MVNKREKQAEFKVRLRQALELRGLRAADLCERTGIPKGAISYYLAGKSNPKADRLYKISKALEVSEAWLIGYDVPMERDEKQKKNDNLAKVVALLRKDSELFDVVLLLSQLPAEQKASIKQIISALGK